MTFAIDLAVIIAGAIALVVAWWIGVFHSGSVIGPDRIRGSPARPLAVVAFGGFLAWIILPALFVSPHNHRFTPQQIVAMGSIGSAAALLVIIISDSLLRPNRLALLGLSPRNTVPGITGGLLGSLLLIPITLASSVLTEYFWRALRIPHPRAHELLLILGGADDPWLRALVFASAIVLAPLFEETFFRGHVQTLLVHAFDRMFQERPIPVIPSASRWLAILAASLLFALVHPLWMMPPIFVLSLGLGYAYERTGNLWTPIILHATFNTLNITLFVYIGQN